jgi:hypothetical protein
MKILFTLVLVLGCDSLQVTEGQLQESQIQLELYMDTEMRDGLYVVQYPQNKESHYTSVEYITSPITRVYWTSQDTFCIEYMGETFCEMIVNYSTYSRDDGSGRQMIYLYRDFIGDTLSVKGCVDVDVCKSVSFTVE